MHARASYSAHVSERGYRIFIPDPPTCLGNNRYRVSDIYVASGAFEHGIDVPGIPDEWRGWPVCVQKTAPTKVVDPFSSLPTFFNRFATMPCDVSQFLVFTNEFGPALKGEYETAFGLGNFLEWGIFQSILREYLGLSRQGEPPFIKILRDRLLQVELCQLPSISYGKSANISVQFHYPNSVRLRSMPLSATDALRAYAKFVPRDIDQSESGSSPAALFFFCMAAAIAFQALDAPNSSRRYCRYCEKPLLDGRSNKLSCDANCRKRSNRARANKRVR